MVSENRVKNVRNMEKMPDKITLEKRTWILSVLMEKYGFQG
ncbi:MAG: hypothetical protein SOR57_01705 [Parabacteroides sp.]|nr:hypothetical protein [Parabacteroides sp.]